VKRKKKPLGMFCSSFVK